MRAPPSALRAGERTSLLLRDDNRRERQTPQSLRPDEEVWHDEWRPVYRDRIYLDVPE
jgi:hypothetical protein